MFPAGLEWVGFRPHAGDDAQAHLLTDTVYMGSPVAGSNAGPRLPARNPAPRRRLHSPACRLSSPASSTSERRWSDVEWDLGDGGGERTRSLPL